jgi:hypothetical protein
MNEDDEVPCLFFAPEDLEMILNEYFAVLNEFFAEFAGNPLVFVPMEEAVKIWLDIQARRLMYDMDKRGLATLGHDGVDICLIANKKPPKNP